MEAGASAPAVFLFCDRRSDPGSETSDVPGRVKVPAMMADLDVNMRTRGIACLTDAPDKSSALDALTGADVHCREVRIKRHPAISMVDHDGDPEGR